MNRMFGAQQTECRHWPQTKWVHQAVIVPLCCFCERMVVVVVVVMAACRCSLEHHAALFIVSSRGVAYVPMRLAFGVGSPVRFHCAEARVWLVLTPCLALWWWWWWCYPVSH